jgi:hypothetical protein
MAIQFDLTGTKSTEILSFFVLTGNDTAIAHQKIPFDEQSLYFQHLLRRHPNKTQANTFRQTLGFSNT